MIITCPNCETRFNIDPAVLQPSGRAVKCMRCAHTWTERPARERPRQGATAATEENTLRVKDLPKKDADADAFLDLDELTGTAPRRRHGAQTTLPIVEDGRRSPRGRLIAAVVAVAVLAVLLGISAAVRNTVIGIWPATASVFEAVGFSVARVGEGLEIRNIKSLQKVEDEKPTISVSGQIFNTTKQPIEIPGLRGALLDVHEREVFVWTFVAGKTVVAPGQTVDFDTTVKEPLTTARRIAVAFYEEKKK
ncbi:MAG: hypothetical protein EXQ91_07565 [Alphaproteobacteria bacterium]|nr:hypothetical protein [Alphaproteobacteria bacterium]